jgi:hypothetical protein
MACSMRSAMLIESDRAATNFGEGGPPLQLKSLRAVRIEAAIRSPPLRPSYAFQHVPTFRFPMVRAAP